MTIEKTFFCTQCGTRLSKNKACKNCGFDINSEKPYGDRIALGAAGYGWSDAVDHPRFANYQSQKRAYSMIFAILLMVGVPVFLLVSGDVSLDQEGIIVMAVVASMFLLIALFSIAGTKRKGKEWMGRIVDKRKKGSNPFKAIIIIQGENGEKFELDFNDNPHQYNYYHINDIIKKHNKPNLRALEKLDKRQDLVLFCPSCAYQADARDHYCQACGSPLLKGSES